MAHLRLWLALLLLLPGFVWAAPSEQLLKQGTSVVFSDTAFGGTDVVLTTKNISTGNGRISAVHDLGSGDRPYVYTLRCSFQVGSAGTVGNALEVYVSTSDGIDEDGEVGTSDAALTSAKLNNLTRALTVIIDTTSTNTPITATKTVALWDRYVSVGYFSNLGVTTRNTDGASFCMLTPYTFEGQ